MASVIFGGGVTNIVGSHAGNTFSRNKGGSYIKRKPLGTNPRSSGQMINRTAVGYLAKTYTHVLTSAQQAAWRSFASTYPVINRLGNTTFLSGAQLFAKLNAPVVRNASALQTLPPSSTAVGSPTALTITAVSGSGGSLKLNLSASTVSANDHANFYFSPPMNPGRNYISSQLRACGFAVGANLTIDFTYQYTSIFGALPSGPGQRIFVRGAIMNTLTGVTSAYIQGSTLWT